MKKLLAAILCFTLAMGVFAGCKKETTQSSSDKKPTLRFLNQDSGTTFDPNNYPVQKFLEEKTGYIVKYDALPAENADDKLNLLMANKEKYDFVKLDPTQFAKLASAGALEPLDTLIKQYGNYITSGTSPDTFASAKINGKIYGIPEKNAKDYVGTVLGVRQSLLDELNLKVPTTTDEFYTFLKTIKEKKGIIPFTADSNSSVISEISGAFGVTNPYEVSNGKIINRSSDSGMTKYLAYMNKLYSEKLLDSEMPVNTVSKVVTKFTSGQAAVMPYAWWQATSVVPALQKTFPNDKVALITNLKGPDGKQGNIIASGISYYTCIPKWCTNKADAIKYINAKLKPDVFKEFVIGKQDVDYTVKNNDMYPVLPTFMNDRGCADWYLTGTDQKAYATLWPIRVRKDANLQSAFEKIQAAEMNSSKADPTSFAPPLNAVSTYSQKLLKYENDSFIKYISGVDNLSNFKSYISQWDSQGGTDTMKELNTWYSSQKSK